VNVGLDLPEFGDAFAAAARRSSKPIVAYVLAPGIEETLESAGIPNFRSVERALRALNALRMPDDGLGARRPARAAPGDGAARDGALDEHTAKEMLKRYGVPVVPEALVTSPPEAVAAARQIGLPVVVKVCAAAIPHKTDVGGVWLDLRSEEDVEAAFVALQQRFPGERALVQKLVEPGVELLLGARRDPQAGPIVVVGLGGSLVELLDDIAICRVPVTRAAALRAVARLRTRRLLDGYRGLPPVDLLAVAGLLERLSELVAATPAIVEVDLNPVIANAHGLVVVDALVRLDGVGR
jgi:acyl-CoA synthetase (NDP forming)